MAWDMHFNIYTHTKQVPLQDMLQFDWLSHQWALNIDNFNNVIIKSITTCTLTLPAANRWRWSLSLPHTRLTTSGDLEMDRRSPEVVSKPL